MLEADLLRTAIFPVMLTGAVLIWRAGRHVAGRLFMLIGALHLSGIWVGRGPAVRMAAAGFINQGDSGVGEVGSKADQELLFWFVLWGLLTILIGQIIIAMERKGLRPPAWFGWELMAINVGAAVLMPKAGFWWVLLPVWLIIRQSGTAPQRS